MSDRVELDAYHMSLWRDVQTGNPALFERAFTDAINFDCDLECSQCAAVFCPHHHPFHFHHDGCPACLGLDVAWAEPAALTPEAPQ